MSNVHWSLLPNWIVCNTGYTVVQTGTIGPNPLTPDVMVIRRPNAIVTVVRGNVIEIDKTSDRHSTLVMARKRDLALDVLEGRKRMPVLARYEARIF